MKRAAIAALLALASVGVTSPAPAQEDLPETLTSALLGSSPSSEAQAEQQADATGTTHAPDRRLRRGCHTYWLSYALQLPTDDWTLETSVIDPRGRAVHAHMFVSDDDETTGRGTYSLCRWATRPGRFTITGKLSWYDDPLEPHEVMLPISTFRLRRP
ncbi:hypothetical protein DDE18_13990 [Nocardioides gansuensis]|uniref:Uncharacterized protein n=1 Tax=Nocardioides gansuensis TaxID=2138300 RepID=A0A2T8F7Y5_9ACTN|nr:hypothetical protein [Nocardioides gansuensis]PVG81834.1 hypothetical protein DDE18_13990 [Nocardioides gansuensis]